MSTEALKIAGVTRVEQRPTFDSNVEYWLADCNGRLGEVYLVSAELQSRIQSLPSLIGFTQCQVMKIDEAQIAVIMPGIIDIPVSTMRSKLGITACVGIGWHIADMLSLLHQSGRAHNLLHPDKIGINDLGELEVRPALGLLLSSDPDPKATAIATDSWQMRSVIQQLGIQERLDPLFALLTRGLQEDVARLRLQPATAIRQSISAVLARHVEWEEAFVKQMGKSWALNQRNIDESVILPHRLQEVRPTFSSVSRQNRNPDVSESIDLWGNLFSSSSVDESSSTQALLLEALRQRKKTAGRIDESSERTFDSLSLREDFQFDESTERLEISIQGISSIQVPVQQPSRSHNGLMSIREVAFTDDQDSMLPEAEHEAQPMAGIVEEIPSDLEALHQRRRMVAMEGTKSGGLSMPLLSPKEVAIDAVVIDEIPLQPIVEEVSEINPVESEHLEKPTVFFPEKQVESDLVSDVDEEANNPEIENTTVVEPPIDTDHGDVENVEVEPEAVLDTVVDLDDDESILSDDLNLSEDVVQSAEIPLVDVVEPKLVSIDSPTLSSDESIEPEMSSFAEDNPSSNDTEKKKDTDAVDHTALKVSEPAESTPPSTLSTIKVTLDNQHPEVDNQNVNSTNSIAVEDESEGDSWGEIEPVDTRTVESQDEQEENVQIDTTESVYAPLSGGSPVSIHNMSLVSIVEDDEDSEGAGDTIDEADEVGMDIAFLMEEEPEPISPEHFNAVFEAEPEVHPSLAIVEPPDSNLLTSDDAENLIDSLEASQVIPEVELDVEEPLADIEFPSIEDVHSQDTSFAGSVNDLFDEPSVVSKSSSMDQVFEEPRVFKPLTSEPAVGTTSVKVAPKQEPKWTGSTAFDNLADEENALGDEKYAHAQVELGDVDAVLGESIRDFSEQERQGSPWALLLIITIVAIFGIGYLLNPQATSSETPLKESPKEVASGNPVASPQVQISTEPPQGRIYIDNVELGIAPLQWEPTEADMFMMCVDWGSNPICRRVPNTDLQTDYIFTRELTP